jgi:hypothetical protein
VERAGIAVATDGGLSIVGGEAVMVALAVCREMGGGGAIVAGELTVVADSVVCRGALACSVRVVLVVGFASGRDVAR